MALEKPAWREILIKTSGLPSWYRLEIDSPLLLPPQTGTSRLSTEERDAPCFFDLCGCLAHFRNHRRQREHEDQSIMGNPVYTSSRTDLAGIGSWHPCGEA